MVRRQDPEGASDAEAAVIRTAPGDKTTRAGRAPATTHAELSHVAFRLFLERGFDETTIHDIAREAGIGRRTFFRYFSSKNELPWGDFDHLLHTMRDRLTTIDDDVPVMEALRTTVIEFNTYPSSELPYHRRRMWLLLNVPSLNAYSTLKYASWRAVIAEFVARRRGEDPQDLTPQTIAWACLGLCLGAYERWLEDEDFDLLELLDTAFRTAEAVFGIRKE